MIPLLKVFHTEIATNPSFAITAMTYKQAGACYNHDTQSDIYVFPSQSLSAYKHIIFHEIGHLYSLKYQKNPDIFLTKIQNAIEKDQLLDSNRKTSLPNELTKLLEEMQSQYPSSGYVHELFPRVLIQFPVLYVLNNPSCTQEDLFTLLNSIMPHTMKVYKDLVSTL